MSVNGNILLVIPARYASTRLPGKPLVKIAGVEMIRRVADIAACICRHNAHCDYVVATDDQRITTFCQQAGIPVCMTSETCRSGTERCRDAVSLREKSPDFIINLQGDNPLCPPWVIQELIDAWHSEPGDVFTPCIRLNWEEYDRLVEAKRSTPYSGTTVLVDAKGYALAAGQRRHAQQVRSVRCGGTSVCTPTPVRRWRPISACRSLPMRWGQ